MRSRVEPSPAGGWHVKLAGHDAPVSHHDTEEDAQARAEAYERGWAIEGERVTLRDAARWGGWRGPCPPRRDVSRGTADRACRRRSRGCGRSGARRCTARTPT